jgi:phosphopantetheinyl transferase
LQKRLIELELSLHARFFLIDLEQIADEEVRVSKECLNSEDREKAMRFHSQKRQNECLFTYMSVKQKLGIFLGEDPARLKFLRNPYGKPYLPGYPLHFNLSHSGAYAFFGIHFEKPIGVDIEKKGKKIPWASFLRSEEIQYITETSQPENMALQFWSAKEVYVKALGIGFSQDIPIIKPHKKQGFFHAHLKGQPTLLTTGYDAIVKDYQIATCVYDRRCCTSFTTKKQLHFH